MTLLRLLAMALLIAPACRREAPPAVVREMPSIRQAPAPTPPPAPTIEPTTSRWSGKPPHPRGVDFSLSRAADAMRFGRGAVQIEIPVPVFGECLGAIPELPAPSDMPLAEVRDEPLWLVLKGDGEAASLRLSTHGALLVVNDGCLRAADLSRALLGTSPGSEDPIFAADTVAPDDALPATDLTMSRDGAITHLTRSGSPWLNVDHFAGEVSFTSMAKDDERWARITVGAETESADGESATGREHTLVWTYSDSEDFLPVMENDFRYGAKGPDHEETRTRATRNHRLPGGFMTATGERDAIDDAMNVGVGRCPEMEGVLAFRHRSESVEWSFVPKDGDKAVQLGEARRVATFASGCLKIAKSEATRRRRLLADRAESGPISWSVAL